MSQEWLKTAREHLGYSQRRMAKALNLHQAYYNRVETGKKNTSPLQRLKLLRKVIMLLVECCETGKLSTDTETSIRRYILTLEYMEELHQEEVLRPSPSVKRFDPIVYGGTGQVSVDGINDLMKGATMLPDSGDTCINVISTKDFRAIQSIQQHALRQDEQLLKITDEFADGMQKINKKIADLDREHDSRIDQASWSIGYLRTDVYILQDQVKKLENKGFWNFIKRLFT